MSVSPLPDQTLVSLDAITTAVTGQISNTIAPRLGRPEIATFYAVFAYGAGGTTVTAYVQTSFDNGVTWCDIACFAFTTAAAVKAMNLISAVSIVAPTTFTDGAMTANTGLSGYLGATYRTKITTTGTYSGATSLNVFAVFK